MSLKISATCLRLASYGEEGCWLKIRFEDRLVSDREIVSTPLSIDLAQRLQIFLYLSACPAGEAEYLWVAWFVFDTCHLL